MKTMFSIRNILNIPDENTSVTLDQNAENSTDRETTVNQVRSCASKKFTSDNSIDTSTNTSNSVSKINKVRRKKRSEMQLLLGLSLDQKVQSALNQTNDDSIPLTKLRPRRCVSGSQIKFPSLSRNINNNDQVPSTSWNEISTSITNSSSIEDEEFDDNFRVLVRIRKRKRRRLPYDIQCNEGTTDSENDEFTETASVSLSKGIGNTQNKIAESKKDKIFQDQQILEDNTQNKSTANNKHNSNIWSVKRMYDASGENKTSTKKIKILDQYILKNNNIQNRVLADESLIANEHSYTSFIKKNGIPTSTPKIKNITENYVDYPSEDFQALTSNKANELFVENEDETSNADGTLQDQQALEDNINNGSSNIVEDEYRLISISNNIMKLARNKKVKSTEHNTQTTPTVVHNSVDETIESVIAKTVNEVEQGKRKQNLLIRTIGDCSIEYIKPDKKIYKNNSTINTKSLKSVYEKQSKRRGRKKKYLKQRQIEMKESIAETEIIVPYESNQDSNAQNESSSLSGEPSDDESPSLSNETQNLHLQRPQYPIEKTAIIKYNNRDIRVHTRTNEEGVFVLPDEDLLCSAVSKCIKAPIWSWQVFHTQCMLAEKAQGYRRMMSSETHKTARKGHLKNVNASIIIKVRNYRKEIEKFEKFGYICKSGGSISFGCNRFQCLKNSTCTCEKIAISTIMKEEKKALEDFVTLYTDRYYHLKLCGSKPLSICYNERISIKDLILAGIIKNLWIVITKHRFYEKIVPMCMDHAHSDCKQCIERPLYDFANLINYLKNDMDSDKAIDSPQVTRMRCLKVDALVRLCLDRNNTFNIWSTGESNSIMITVDNNKPVPVCRNITEQFRNENVFRQMYWMLHHSEPRNESVDEMWLMIKKKKGYWEADKFTEDKFQSRENPYIILAGECYDNYNAEDGAKLNEVIIIDDLDDLNEDYDNKYESATISNTTHYAVSDREDRNIENSLNIESSACHLQSWKNKNRGTAKRSSSFCNVLRSYSDSPTTESGSRCNSSRSVLTTPVLINDMLVQPFSSVTDMNRNVHHSLQNQTNNEVVVIPEQSTRSIKNEVKFEESDVEYVEKNYAARKIITNDETMSLMACLPACTNVCKWNVVPLRPELSYLKFPYNTVISSEQIKNAFARASNKKGTVCIRLIASGSVYHTHWFGTHCDASNREKVFVGPYLMAAREGPEVFINTNDGPIRANESSYKTYWFFPDNRQPDDVVDLTLDE